MKDEQQAANTLPAEGFVRLRQIIGYVDKKTGQRIPGVLPIGKTKWWEGVKDGVYPKPARKDGPRCTLWDVADIRKLLERKAS